MNQSQMLEALAVARHKELLSEAEEWRATHVSVYPNHARGRTLSDIWRRLRRRPTAEMLMKGGDL